jgi:hypothetical protein
MGREIRIGLLLTAAACLMAVLADWAVEELTSEVTLVVIEEEQVDVEAAPEDAGTAQDATAESYDQG